MIEYVFAAIGVIGAVLVAMGKPLQANYVWSVSNPCFVYHNYLNNDVAQCVLFTVFTLVSWIGVINLRWRKNND